MHEDPGIRFYRPSHDEAMAHTAPVTDLLTAEFVPRCESGRSDLALPDDDAGPTAARSARLGVVALHRVLRSEYAPFVQSGPDPPTST